VSSYCRVPCLETNEWFVPWESSSFFGWIFLKQKSLFLLKLNGKLGLSWYSKNDLCHGNLLFFFFFWWIFLKQKSLFLLKLNGKLGLSWYSRGNSKSPLLILVLLEFGIFNLICCYSSWLYDLSCSLPLFGRVDRVLLEWLFWFEFGYKINK
jgi:hypothetical protein